MRRSHVQHDTARVPRRTPFWPKPQKGAKALFPGHPAALMNEPPAPHRARQVAAKSGMLQTRSRPQSCGFRPPVLITTAKRRRGSGVGRPIFSASGRTAKTSTRSRGCPRPCALVPSIRRPRRMNRPLPTGSDRLPPKAACCKPVHAHSPAVSGRLFWRPPPVGRQCSGVGRPCPSR